MKQDLPKRWKIAIIAALASGITSALNIPESYGLVAQILGSLL
jgi:hypothetical protein